MRRSSMMAIAAVLTLPGICLAQKFSNPSPPLPPASAPAGTPAPPASPVVHPDGTTTTPGGITLPSGLYDEKAVGQEQINEASRRAKRENKRVLLVWGENNCEFCVRMKMLFTEDQRIRQVLDAEYVIQRIDIGKFNKHLDVAINYNTNVRDAGAPTLTIIDPVSDTGVGVLRAKDAVAQPMTMTRVWDEKVVFDFLWNNKANARLARSVYDEALAKAKRDDKRVLVQFLGSTCEPCARLNAWLARDPVADALGKAFVIVRIDAERMIAAGTVLSDVAGAGGSLPLTAIVDPATGKPADAAHLLKDLGATPESVTAFQALLASLAPTLSEGERTMLGQTLTEARTHK